MLTFNECAVMIKKGRSTVDGFPARKLKKNTYLYYDGNSFHVRLYNTDVVSILPKNAWVIRSGGWRTPLTKDRIHEYAPVRISQAKNTWYYSIGSGRKLFDFSEGVLISAEHIVEEYI